MKVLILADIPGWIVDHLTDRMITYMPDVHFTKGFYACLTTHEIAALARDVDLIHYQNWDIARHWPGITQCAKPLIVSVRSHRYPKTFLELEVAKRVAQIHAVNPAIARNFNMGSQQAIYIPDGLDSLQPFVVGFVGRADSYKGFNLISEACRQLGATFNAATGQIARDEMSQFYQSCSVVVCSSEQEGFSTIVMEALAANRPVVSTRVGLPWELRLDGITWVDRTVEAIKAGIAKHWTALQLTRFGWSNVANQFRLLYQQVYDNSKRLVTL